MPVEIVKHACSLCGAEFDYPVDAVACEKHGLPYDQQIKIPGEEIDYFVDIPYGVARFTDRVVSRSICRTAAGHAYVYGVEADLYDRLVVWMPLDGVFLASSDMCYKRGSLDEMITGKLETGVYCDVRPQ